MSKYTTRVLYRKKTKQQISDSVKRPEITPISKKKLNKEIAAYEEMLTNIPTWPFVSLINWKLQGAAKSGNNHCHFKISDLVKLSDASVDDNLNIIPGNTLHNLRVALIDKYSEQLARYYAQKDLKDTPDQFFKRFLWLLNHNKISYGVQAHEEAGNEWIKAMTIYSLDSTSIIAIRDAVVDGFQDTCCKSRMIYNEHLKKHDLILDFEF